MVVGNEGFVALALTHNTTCRQSYYTMHALFTERKVHKFVGNITLWTWLPMIQPLMQHDKMVIHKHYACTKEVTGYEVRNALGLSKWS